MRLLELYDAARTTRFHTTVDYTGVAKQNLAEHSWGVAMLCNELCRRQAAPCSADLLMAALTHDLAESWTCDMPAHVKWEFPELRSALAAAEAIVEQRMGLTWHANLKEWELNTLKWADSLELLIYSSRRMAAGMSGAKDVVRKIAKHMRTSAAKVVTGEDLRLLMSVRVGLAMLDELENELGVKAVVA